MISLMLKMLLGKGDRRAMLDTMLAHHDSHIFALDDLIPPPQDADARNPFTSYVPVEEHSVSNLSPGQRLTVGPTMLKLMAQMNRSAEFYKERFTPTTREASEDHIAGLEALAKRHGATAVRYVQIPDDCIFAGKAIPHREAIIYSVRMSKEILDTAPSFEAFAEVARGYMAMAVIGNQVTEFLRARGHAAYPGTALGGLTDYTRLAEVAGLGEIGYHGLLITPEEGALLRLNTIYTSIQNLPFDRPAAIASPWVRDFCAMCKKCVRACPPGAIHDAPINLENGRVQSIDTEACRDYFATHYGCAICADVCPFTQSGYDIIGARFKGNPSAPAYHIPRYGDAE